MILGQMPIAARDFVCVLAECNDMLMPSETATAANEAGFGEPCGAAAPSIAFEVSQRLPKK